jgi:hypothetical protein
MTQSIKNFGVGSIAFAALMLLVLPLSYAKADGGDIGFDTIDTSYPMDSGYSGGYNTVDTSYPISSGYDTVDTSYPLYDSYGYSTPSYSTGYGTGGFMTGGYSSGGYMTGGGYLTSYHPTLSTPVASAPSYSNTYAPTTVTTNTCTGNSCNHDDHSVVNIQNPAPVINNNNVVANYAQPVATSYSAQQYCANGFYGTYPNCYRNNPPIAYNNTPYVSLSQVPYTGLELGFWGSIAYWGAFVLFALFAAYLIAIKRVQNTIANYLKSVLFGADEEVIVETPETAPSAPAPAAAPEVTQTQGDVIDSFIMSQINRARHA